jgi:thiamine pyrophosphokinase
MEATPRTAIVIAGGGSLDPRARAQLAALPVADLVIAADSGLDVADVLGLDVVLAIGDFDSVTAAALEAAERRGVTVERHPVAKNAIDLELALDAAQRAGAQRIIVIGGDGGRLDMAAANLLLLASPAYAELDVEAFIGHACVHVVRGELVLTGRPGERLSLLPVHGPAIGITTEGLRYPLVNEDLPAGTTRGCSNEFAGERARITIEGGTLLCVQPGDD